MPEPITPKTDTPRRLRDFRSDDLVNEIKARIANRELRETVLLDLSTGRIYSDFEMEDRRFLGTGTAMRIIFPMTRFDPDSMSHRRVEDVLIDLPDDDFKAVRSAVRAELEEGLQRLVKLSEELGASEMQEQSSSKTP